VRCGYGEEALSNTMTPADNKRHSARIILLNAAQQVLLIRFLVAAEKAFLFLGDTRWQR
jgi:hypothetical protein